MNFITTNKRLGKMALILALVLFLLVSAFGLINHMNEMKMMGVRDGCAFSGTNEVCPMNLSAHITLWQEMFTGLPQNTALLGLLLLTATLFTIFSFWKNYLIELYRRVSFRFRFYAKQHPQINLFNYLKEVFYRGILNSKAYETVTL